jgi:hypothetical protein
MTFGQHQGSLAEGDHATKPKTNTCYLPAWPSANAEAMGLVNPPCPQAGGYVVSRYRDNHGHSVAEDDQDGRYWALRATRTRQTRLDGQSHLLFRRGRKSKPWRA